MNNMVCDCCGASLQLSAENEFWKFWHCPSCDFWTSRTPDGNFPSYDYFDAKTFDRDAADNWNSLIEEAAAIMKYKFSLFTPPPHIKLCVPRGGAFWISDVRRASM